jgi:hypothetical protein
LRLFDRLRILARGLIKPVRAGCRRLPRLWAFITGKKTGPSLYRQKFSGLDLRDLLAVVDQDLPGGRQGKTGKQAYCPPPGMVRLNGSFLWAGKSPETSRNGVTRPYTR